jgi:hypothetical protein
LPVTTVRYSPVTLRVEPHAIPEVRAVFEDAVGELTYELNQLRQDGYIPEPWLGDPMSAMVQQAYNSRVMDAIDGPYHALVTYLGELTRVRDHLVAAEAEYTRTEGANAEMWGRM